MILTLGRFPRSILARQAARIRVRLRRRQLDAALARGADPWSAADLMLRASQLGSLPRRQQLAATLETLVLFAQHNRPVMPNSQVRAFSPCLRIRCGAVRDQSDPLLELAARLREPAPVSVAVVATLAWLASDESSPVYVGGDPPESLADTAARCGWVVTRASERL